MQRMEGTAHARVLFDRDGRRGASRLPKLPGTSNLPMDTQHAFNSQNLQFEG